MTSKSVFILILLFISYSNSTYYSNAIDWLFGVDDSLNSKTDFNRNSNENVGYTSFAMSRRRAPCSLQSGCDHGRCWKRCAADSMHTYGSSCYTVDTPRAGVRTIKCKRDSECSPCWPCGIPCNNNPFD